MKRILFFSEAVTLAQVVRLKSLADSLDPAHCEVHFAASHFDPMIFGEASFRCWQIKSISDTEMQENALGGRRIYDERTLSGYIDEERELFARIRPDLVVGDLRWSLPISTALAKIPLASLINAYWSREHHEGKFPLPDHPSVNWLGARVAGFFYPMARPVAFRFHASPVNRLCQRYGLRRLGTLDEMLTYGDYTLFPDVPGLVPVRRVRTGQRFLGPILWSPEVPLPDWWREIPSDRPCVYVTLGSSGRVDVLPRICELLQRRGVTLIVSTAGRASAPGEHVFAAPFLPGHLAARRADLVVCHGGSTTAYQALAEGVPVLGVPSNLDQWLSMKAIERANAGIGVRADRHFSANFEAASARLLAESAFRAGAARVKEEFSTYSAGDNFRAFLKEAILC